ncbi:MAG: DNA-directed RNA polymerase subunit P [Candidatus Micrarchaeia archaeon]
MAYVCAHCGKKIKDPGQFIRCPYCGYRVLIKARPNIPKEVSTD